MERQGSAEAAAVIALDVLGWMAADPEMIGRFMGETGLDIADLRRAAKAPELQVAVLDFLLGDDRRVLACAEALSLPPEAFQQALAALPGGQSPHWT